MKIVVNRNHGEVYYKSCRTQTIFVTVQLIKLKCARVVYIIARSSETCVLQHNAYVRYNHGFL